MRGANTLYLHYLDRELTTAAGGGPSAPSISGATRLLCVLSDSLLYCGLSALWENDRLDARAMADLEILLACGELTTISGDATQAEFLESRRVAYEHDRARYPRYYGQEADLSWAVPVHHKAGGSTNPLVGQMYQWASELPSGGGRFVPAALRVGPPVLEALRERGDRAVTYSLFEPFLPDLTSGRSEDLRARIRRQISHAFSIGNLKEFAGDIATGIEGLAIFDDMANSFPLHDVRLLALVADLADMADVVDRDVTRSDAWLSWAQARKGPEARILAGSVRWILTAMRDADLASVPARSVDPNQHFSPIQVRQRLRERLWDARRLMQSRAPNVSRSSPARDRLTEGHLRLQGASRILADNDPVLADALDRTRGSIMPTRAQVVIMTVNDIETEELRRAFEDAGHSASMYAGQFGVAWIYGPIGGVAVATVRSGMGNRGPAGAGLTALAALTELRSEVLMSVGVAFAMSDDAPIGQLLVSEQLADYELARLGTGIDDERVVIRRGGRESCSPQLLSLYRDSRLEDIGISVKPGLMLSGEKLVDYLPYRQELADSYPEALGGEMEGSGILSAGIRQRAHWIVAKAVCDHGHGKKEDKIARQTLAARNAAQAAVRVVGTGGLERLTRPGGF